jgi:uncharacterized protein involved in tolerance to divalent cations
MSKYYEVKVSAENQDQADKILNSLLEKKLVTGGQFIKADASFLWKGKVVDMPGYITITSYSTVTQKEAIIEDVRKTSAEEVPMIAFIEMDDLNPELKEWISSTLS